MRIPRIPATQSMGRLPLNPRQACHPVHGKPATQSTARLPPSERSDAGWHIISLNWLFLSTGPAVAPQLIVVTHTSARSDVAGPVKDAHDALVVPSELAG